MQEFVNDIKLCIEIELINIWYNIQYFNYIFFSDISEVISVHVNHALAVQ